MNLKPENGKKLLILDVDETLVYSTEDAPLPRGADFIVLGDIYVHKRPGLEKFFPRVSPAYDIAFWSAGGRDYVQAVLRTIVPASIEPDFIWSRERCTPPRIDGNRGDKYVLKPLSRLRRSYDLNRVVIVDDDPRTASRNFGNLIRMQPFEGDLADYELEYLADYLLSIRDVPNFRRLEKRNWRAPFVAQKNKAG